MAYEIEKGVPLAPSRVGQGNKKYPLREMGAGDSFFVPRGNSTMAVHCDRVRSAARIFGARNGVKFATRREGDGVRVTRIE